MGEARKTSWLPVVLGILLSVGAAAFLLSRVSFGELWTAIGAADARWFAPALVVFFFVFGLRAWRWAVLCGGTPIASTWHANMIGYFFNATLPLRIGEVARAYVLSRKTGVSMPRAFSGVIAERLLDLAAVLLAFSWFAARISMRESFTRAAMVGSVIVVVGVASGALVVVKGDAVERMLRPRLDRRFGSARADSMLAKLLQMREGLAAVGSPRRLAAVLVLTVAIWGGTIVLAYLCLRAFLPGSFEEAGLVVVTSNLGGALPSAPGGLGIVQSFATTALVVPFHVPESLALAFVLVWSFSQTILLLLLGAISIGRVGLSFHEIRTGALAKGPDPGNVTPPE